jgi:3-ketosteroid 9alpha-monooxygenase subunit B
MLHSAMTFRKKHGDRRLAPRELVPSLPGTCSSGTRFFWNMFHSLRVADIVDETHDAKSIVFEVPSTLVADFAYRSGQFLTVQVDCGGELLQRCYSIASSPDCNHEHKVTVKRVQGGRVSNWLNDHLRVGDRLGVMRPEGRFVLDGVDTPLLLFAGGSGITPVISILKTALLTSARRATLLYANRDTNSVIFRAELDDLERRYPDRARVVHRFDDAHGLLDAQTVHALVAEARNASCYVCGPGPFMNLVERESTVAGIAPERIRLERFTLTAPARPAAPAQPVEGAELPEYLEVELGGKRHRVPYTPGKTLLRAARDGGLNAPFSCEEGSCGCCAADLLEGRVVMDTDEALSADEKRRGVILACQSRPVTRKCAFRFVGS